MKQTGIQIIQLLSQMPVADNVLDQHYYIELLRYTVAGDPFYRELCLTALSDLAVASGPFSSNTAT